MLKDLWAPRPCFRSHWTTGPLFITDVLPCTSFVVQLNIYQIKIQMFILCNSSTGRSDEGVGGWGAQSSFKKPLVERMRMDLKRIRHIEFP